MIARWINSLTGYLGCRHMGISAPIYQRRIIAGTNTGGLTINKEFESEETPNHLDEYFLPDLCSPQAVFFLVLVVQALHI